MCSQLNAASGSRYSVIITLHSYSNLQQTCSRCSILLSSNGCCDDYRVRHPQCTGSLRCDTLFSFCLVPEGSFSFNPPTQCSGPSINTDTLFDSDETISFAPGAVLGIINPFVLHGISTLWMVIIYYKQIL